MEKLFFLFAVASIAACSKDPSPNPPNPPNPNPIDSPVAPPKAYSYWKVGNDSFKSNNVVEDIGKAITVLSCRDRNEIGNFSILFRSGIPPGKTYFNLCNADSQRQDCTGINFYSKGEFYILLEPGFLLRDTGKKSQFRLGPTWFANYYNRSDRVLISGVFREP